MVTAGTGAKKARGKRKGKEGSVRSGTAKGTADGRSVVGQPGEEADGEEEEEGEGDEGMVEDGGRVDRVAEKKNLAYVVLERAAVQTWIRQMLILFLRSQCACRCL